MITPDFRAQMRDDASPDFVAFNTAVDMDFPYHAPPQIIGMNPLIAMASEALIEFHDIWIRWAEKNHG